MNFTGIINGYDVIASFWNGQVSFRCDALGHKSFDSADKIEKAIAAYDLTLRKQFSNRIAWVNHYSRGVEQVEVTSHDGEHAFIKRNDRREKVRRTELFEDKDALIAMIKQDAEQSMIIKEQWLAVKRWEPKP